MSISKLNPATSSLGALPPSAADRPQISRREIVGLSLQLPMLAGSLVVSGLVQSAEQKCVDPEELTPGELGLRQSLHYTQPSPKPDQSCSACGFFETAEESRCGTCRMLNGPVDVDGWCDSWSKRS